MNSKNKNYCFLWFNAFFILCTLTLNAQRIPHKASSSSHSKRSLSHNNSVKNKVSNPSKSNSKTATNKSTTKHEVKSDKRDDKRDFKQDKREDKREVKQDTRENKRDFKQETREEKRDVRNDYRTSNVRNGNVGNNIHIGDTNINIDIDRDFRAYGSPIRYTRPPYVWGGRSYYCHHVYWYHPYRPYYWDDWYPWGRLLVSIVETAIIVSVIDSNNNSQDYNYENGNYYLKTPEGFVAVPPPVGAQVPSIPNSATVVNTGAEDVYYYGGGYYKKNTDGYVVVPAVAGTIVPYLPEGGEEIKIGEQTYVVFGDVYYQPIQIDGKDMYEIVEVK